MASVVQALNDALSEDKAYLKIFIYAIPVYFVTNLFLVGQMGAFTFWCSVLGFIILGLLTQGIHNVRINSKEILPLNPLHLIFAGLKALIVIIPYALVIYFAGTFLCGFNIPIDLPHTQLIYEIIVWTILSSIVFTAYLSFAKYLKISQGYNMKVIVEACVDVLISFLFFIPQLALADAVLVAPVAYLYTLFNLPYNHWGFVAICSAIFILNISILANYCAQSAYEQVRGNNEDYEDNHLINLVTLDRMDK